MVFRDEIEAIARELGAKADAVRQWRSRKVIPWSWRFRISEEARRRKIAIEGDAFDKRAAKKRRAA